MNTQSTLLAPVTVSLLLFLLLPATAGPTRQETFKEYHSYTNPVISSTLADPAVLRHNGTYYLYGTGQVEGGDEGYRVWTSRDLVNWERGEVVFNPDRGAVWAPDVWRNPEDGRFYLFWTISQTVGVASADSPTGPFTNQKTFHKNAIDAHLFQDRDGSMYLYFVDLAGFKIKVQPMNDPYTPGGDPETILQPTAEWETRNGNVTEGPWIVSHDGTYYLLYSGCGADTPDYTMGYATADDPTGPFTRADHNPVIHRATIPYGERSVYGPGHGCAVRDGEGKLWFVYHQKRNEEKGWGRFIALDRLWFDRDGKLHGRATRGTARRAPAPLESSSPQ